MAATSRGLNGCKEMDGTYWICEGRASVPLKEKTLPITWGLLGRLRVFLDTGDKIPKMLPGYFSINIMKDSPAIATLLAKTKRATLTSMNYAFLKVAHRHTAVIKRDNEIFICSRAMLCQQRIRNASQQERPESTATSGQNVRPSKCPFPSFPKTRGAKERNNF